MAKSHGITIVGISDHDNLGAYFEVKSYADAHGVLLVPAIELSCAWEGVDVHILAYAFDAVDGVIDERLRGFRETRHARGKRMVEKLHELGYPISLERVDQLAAGGSMGRPHVARALVEAGFVSTVAEAFDTLIGAGKPAYVEKQRFRIDEAISLIHAASGVLSVAHPTLYPNHEELVTAVLDAGIDGVEVFHPDVDEAARERYTHIARFRGKMITGGSDDHGSVKAKLTLGTIKVPETLLGPIMERMS